ncbi:MAG TPA: hypothetical protein VHN19_18290 [Burkholderiales bacterium]|jgi:hypothetical protein|nr:hypothetical protein [Burkholderiales bacterium]
MRVPVLAALSLFATLVLGAAAPGGEATALREKYKALETELRDNAFGRPLHLDSKESSDEVMGDAYAVLAQPFAKAGAALAEPANWCDILLLPFNTKQCRVVRDTKGNPGEPVLDVRIGRKSEDNAEQAYPVKFQYRVARLSTELLQVRLGADEGPLSTRDYRIALEAIPLPGDRTFLHLSYAYGFGMSGRLAMKAYLATAGADKIGFTVTGKDEEGKPRYVGGMRGVIERNTMRYYLAIEAFLGALNAGAERSEKAAHDWFAATERYPRQLHEMDEAQYVSMKKKEYARQAQAGARAQGT